MFKMLTQIWFTISVFFAALEKFANALNHIGTWTEESAGGFADEAREQRQQKLAALTAQTAVATASSASTVATATATKGNGKAAVPAI